MNGTYLLTSRSPPEVQEKSVLDGTCMIFARSENIMFRRRPPTSFMLRSSEFGLRRFFRSRIPKPLRVYVSVANQKNKNKKSAAARSTVTKRSTCFTSLFVLNVLRLIVPPSCSKTVPVAYGKRRNTRSYLTCSFLDTIKLRLVSDPPVAVCCLQIDDHAWE
ncbi:unnamed protein product [Amoebophrya sp. A120]|nr:unnamed protein product [Amoebophrya sp. A120]|eukprot:GSA120T00004902001.1